jgi:hypothetical protein
LKQNHIKHTRFEFGSRNINRSDVG